MARREGRAVEEPRFRIQVYLSIVGLLLSALHLGGLATLTHTPSLMKFLRELLERPANERAFVVIPVGDPKDGADVPAIGRKSLDDVRVLR